MPVSCSNFMQLKGACVFVVTESSPAEMMKEKHLDVFLLKEQLHAIDLLWKALPGLFLELDREIVSCKLCSPGPKCHRKDSE